MTYGLSTWYISLDKKRHNKTHLATLESLQYKTQKIITGAFTATSKSALNIETYILSVKQRLNQLACRSALRIATTPTYQQIIECWSHKSTQIKTNLEILLNTVKKHTGIKTEDIEVSTAFLVPPWWTPPLISIASTKEQAINQHKTTIQNSMSKGLLLIYTDSSGINGKIGASAVAASISDHAYLGPDTQYTVFAGKLYGILLALYIAYFIIQIEKRTNTKTPIIYTDNQADL